MGKRVQVGGDSDNRSLQGTARGYTGAQPALPIVVMARERTANPIVVLDEIEKVSPSRRHGNPHDSLLGMLEPGTAGRWFDRCLMASVDLRHVVWIATANTIEGLSAPLLSRFDVVRVQAPDPSQSRALLTCVMEDMARHLSIPVSAMPRLESGAVEALMALFSRTGSIRALRKGVELAVGNTIRERLRILH